AYPSPLLTPAAAATDSIVTASTPSDATKSAATSRKCSRRCSPGSRAGRARARSPELAEAPEVGMATFPTIRALRRFSVFGDLVQGAVFGAGIDPVLELDDAQLGELLPQPTVAGVEDPELLAVGHDLGEQQRL